MSTSSLPSFIKIHLAVLEKKSKIWKVYGRTTTDDDDGRTDGRTDDGRCAMTIAHLNLRLRWAKNKMAALASDWLTHFRLLCNRWTELNETWQEARFYSSFTEFVFFGPIGKTRGLPWPLIGWDIFDFVSETAKQNLTKLDRKHDLNALYQVCVFFFRAHQKKKNKMAALASVLA